MSDKKRPETFRDPKNVRTEIRAKNPVLIVGAGPSYERNLDKIKNFKGTVICFEVNFHNLFRKGIIPDYILTLEIYVRPDVFLLEKYLSQCKDKTKVICSASTHKSVLKRCEVSNVPATRWISEEEPRFSNVGTFALNYAIEVLKADKVFIIGFENDGGAENKTIYEFWKTDFWYFLQQWPKETIVNCTDGGQLYYEDYILDATLDSLV